MGVFSQLGLVLWKNLILRKRQPVILLLEIVWPIIIFLIVTLVRRSVPPTTETSCHYAPRAMPTAGISFLQDYVCNLDNKCYPSEEEAQNSRTISGTASFLQAVQPLYNKRNETQKFLENLPQTKKVLDSVTEVLEKPEIKELLDLDFKVKNFFRDPQKVRRYLVVEAKVLSGPTADALLDASINITKIFDLTGNINFKSIVCNASELTSYLTFPRGTSVQQVSTSLCGINDTMVSNITSFLQSQIDVAAIIRIAKQLEAVSGNIDNEILLNDLAILLDLIMNLNTTQNLIGNMAMLQTGVDFGIKIADFINKVSSGPVDYVMIIGQILNDLDPLLQQWLGNDTMFQGIRSAFAQVAEVTKWMNGQLPGLTNMDTLSLGNLLGNQTGIVNILGALGNLSIDAVNTLLNMPINETQISKLINSSSNGDLMKPLCMDPGLANLFEVNSTRLKTQLKQLQTYVCSPNNTDVLMELGNMINITYIFQKMSEMQNPHIPINWTTILQDFTQIVGGLQSAMGQMDPLMNLLNSSFSAEALFRSLAQLASGVTDMNNIDAIIQQITPIINQVSGQILPNQTDFDQYQYIIYGAVEIMESVAKRMHVFGDQLHKLLQENADFRKVVQGVVSLDPKTAPEIIARLLDPIRIQSLFNSSSNLDKVLCEPMGLAKFLELDPSKVNVTGLSGLLCNRNLSAILGTVVQNFDVQGIQKQIEHMIAVLEGRVTPQPVNYTLMVTKVTSLTNILSNQTLQNMFMKSFNGIPGLFDPTKINVTNFTNQFSEAFIISVLSSTIQSVGMQIENSTAWNMVAGIVKSNYYQLVTAQVAIHFFEMLNNEATDLGKIVKAFIDYFPEIMFEMYQLTMDQLKYQRFITEVSTDPQGVFCNYTRMAAYLDPIAMLPLQSVQSTLCMINYTQVGVTVMIAYQNASYQFEKSLQYMFNNKSDVYQKDVNWGQFFQMGKSVSDFVMGFTTTPSKYAHWERFNYIRLLEALNSSMSMLDMFNNFTVDSVQQQTGMIEQLLASMSASDPSLNYYVYAINEYLKVMTKYMKMWGENGLMLTDFIGKSSWLHARVNDLQLAMPDVLKSLQNVTTNPAKLSQMLSTMNYTGAQLCKNVQLTDFLTVHNKTKLQELEKVLCGINVTLVLEEFMNTPMMKEMGQVLMMFQTYDPNKLPANYKANMTELVGNAMVMVDMYTKAFGDANVINKIFPGLIKGFNNTAVQTTGQHLLDSLRKMMMSFDNKTIEQTLQEQGAMLEQQLISLTADPTFKYYIYAINQYITVSTKYMRMWGEKGLMLTDFIGQSTWLHARVNDLQLALPDVLQSLQNVTANPDRLTQMLTTMNLTGVQLCKDIQLSDFLSVQNKTKLHELEKVLCGVNVTILMEELMKTPMMKEMNDVMVMFTNYDPMKVPANFTANITEVLNNAMIMFDLYTKAMADTNAINKLFPGLVKQFNNTALQTTGQQLMDSVMKILMSYDNKTIEQTLQEQSAMLQGTLGSLSIPGGDQAYNYYVYAINQLLKYQIKYQRMWGQKGFYLADLVGNGTWLYSRVQETIKALPELLQTLSNVTMNPEKLLQKLGSLNMTGAQLCKDIHLTEFLTVKNQSQLSQLEKLLCGVNVTTLTQQLMEIPMVKEQNDILMMLMMYDPVKYLPPSYKANTTELEQNIMTFINVLMQNSANPNALMGLFPELMANLNMTALNITGQHLIDYLMKMDLNSLSRLSSLGALAFGTMGDSPETKMVMGYINAIVEINMRATIILEPEKFAAAFPNLVRYKFVFDALPDLLAGLIRSSDAKTQQSLQAALTNPMVLCMMPNVTHLINLPPGSKVNLNTLVRELCTINMTVVMMEFNNLANYFSEPFTGAMTANVNQTELMMKIQTLQNEYTMLFTGNKTLDDVFGKLLQSFKLIDGNMWTTVLGEAFNKTMSVYNTTNPADFMGYASSLQDINNMLNNSMINMQLNMIDAIVTEALNKLKLLNVNSSLVDLFPQSPELAKLAKMVEKFPYILELIALSANTPQFQALLSNQNITSVFLTLCHPMSNLTDIFVVPANWTGDMLTQLQQEFCAIDVMKLEGEVYVEFNIKYIMDQAQNPAPVNWTVLFYKISMAVELVSGVIASPPREFATGSWTNETLWLSILMAMNEQQMQQYSSQQNLQSYYGSLVLLSELLVEDTSGLQGLVTAVESVIKTLNQQLDLLMKPNLSIYDLFADSPETLQLLGVVNSSSDLTMALLKIPLLNTTSLLNLQNETSASLCNKSLSYYKSMFQVTENKTAMQLRDLLCKIDAKTWDKISVELSNKIGIAELLVYLGFQPSSNGTNMGSNNRTVNLEDLSKNTETLIQKLMTVFGNNSTMFNLPYFNQTAVEKTIAKLYTNMNATNIDSLIPAIMASMAPLYGTPLFDTVMRYQQSVDVIITYFHDMFAMMYPNANGTVDIEVLFGNSTQWKQLLRGALDVGIGPNMLSLSQIQLRTDKSAELMALNETQLQKLLCNETLMHRYIMFPAALNVTKIVSYTCGLDAKTLIQEFEKRFDPTGFVQRIMNALNATSASWNTTAITERYTKMVQDLMRLGNITDPRFFGKTVADFMKIDPNAFINMNMTQVMNAALGNIPGFTGTSVQNFTSIEDVLNSAFNSVQLQLAQIGVTYQDENYNTFLKLVDAVIRTVFGRLEQQRTAGGNVITLKSLVGNIPALEQVLLTVFNLDPDAVIALLNLNIPIEYAKNVFYSNNMTVVKEYMCHPNLTVEWFEAPPGGNLSVLQSQLCAIDYNMLWEQIQVHIEYQKLMPILMKLLNSSSTQMVPFNWTEYSTNIQAWKDAINILIADPPQVSSNLTKLFDQTKILQIINTLMQQQLTTEWAGNMYAFVKTIPGLAPNELNMFLDMMIIMLKSYQDKGYTLSSLFTSPELIKEYGRIYIKEIGDARFKVALEPVIKDIFMKVPNAPRSATELCTVQNVSSILKSGPYPPVPAYWNITQISNILCKTASSQWIAALTKAGFHMSEISQIAHALAKRYNIDATALPIAVPWTEVHTNVDTLANLLILLSSGLDANMANMTMADQQKLIETLAGALNQTTAIEQVVDIIKLADYILTSGHMDTSVFRQSIHLIAGILNYTNSRIAEMSNGTSINLGNLFPQEAELRKELSKFLSNQSINDLLQLSMNPSMLPNMTNATAWQEFVCNMTTFNNSVSNLNINSIKNLQAELCSSAMDGNNVMAIMLQYLNMNTFAEMLANLTMNQTMTMPIEQNPYKFLQRQLNTMVGNLQMFNWNMDMSQTTEWMNLFNSVLNSPMTQVQMPGSDNYVDICTSTLAQIDQSLGGNNQIMYQMLQSNLDSMEMYIEFMDLMPLMTNLTCDLSMTNLTGMYKRLNDSRLPQLIMRMTNMFMNANASMTSTFNCSAFVHTATKYAEVVNASSYTLPDVFMKGWQCFQDSSSKALPALTQIDGILQLFVEVQGLLTGPALIPGLPMDQITPYINVMIETLFKQKPLMVRFEDILQNGTDLEITGLTQDVIDAIMSSTVDLTLATLWEASDQELAKILCNPTELTAFLNLPLELFNTTAISSQICGSNITSVIAEIRGGLDIGKIFYLLSQNIPTYVVNSDWLNQLSADIGNLTTSIGPLLELSELMTNFDLGKLAQQLPKLQEFANQGGVEAILENIKSIVAGVAEILPDDPLLQGMFNDLQILIDGLKALHIINRLNVQVRLRDVLKDPIAVESYMMNTLGLSQDVAQAVLDSQLSSTEMINLTQRLDLKKLVCDPKELSTLLQLSSNGTSNTVSSNVTMNDISTELCMMTDTQIVDLVNFIQGELKIGDILQQIITLNPETIMKNIGVDVKEFQKTLSTFAPLQENFKQFSEQMKNLPEDLLTSAEALQQGQGDSTKTLSKLMCGRDNAFTITDEFQLGSENVDIPKTAQEEPSLNTSSSGRKKRATLSTCNIDWTDWQRYEMSRFRTKFCEDMYKGLQCSENGRIIWSFLKPLLMGRIPFTPDNAITRAIMNEATKIFQDVEQIKNFSKLFVDSSDYLQQFADSAAQLNTLEEALKNPFMNQIVYDILGTDPTALTSQLKSLSGVTSKELNALKTVSELLYNASHCIHQYRTESYRNESTLIKQSQYYADRNELLAAIHFTNMDNISVSRSAISVPVCEFIQNAPKSVFPKHITFKIIMGDDNVPESYGISLNFWVPGPEDSFAENLRYFRGFIQLQDLIERAIIKLQTGCEGDIPAVESEQFPYPCYEQDLFQKYVSLYMFPVMMVLALLVVVGSSIKNIVYDKEHRLEEAMHAMGLASRINWLGWFLNTFIFMLIMDLIIVLFLKFGNLYRFTDFGLLFVFLAAFSLCTLMMCYLVSVFFYRTTLAALVGLIVYLVSYVPYIVLANMTELTLEFWQIFLACLSGTTAFSYGAQMLSHMEQRGTGMQWGDVPDGNIYRNFSFAWIFYMMLIDSAIYFIIGWYLRNVLPGKYGVSQPWYFPLSPYYWGCCSHSKGSPSSLYRPHNGAQKNVYDGDGSVAGLYIKKLDALPVPTLTAYTNRAMDDYSSIHSSGNMSGLSRGSTSKKSETGEGDPESLPIGISLHNLTKKFGKKRAISNVSVNFYQNQITAFLGQNGVGKSTTVNVLTGIYEPTSGDAFINNHSICKDMTKIRKDLGVCPQNDVLFEYMTVYEHLDFYASLKGKQSKREIKEDINRMLDLTGLRPSSSAKVSQLSGGQRRRLSVALAFIGGSNVVILDEPTSGIDSCARRSIWDMIVQNRAGRTIIISTHHMDEADVLGDRIVLMHNGKVLTTGSPLYLKSQYGSGYQLTVSNQASAPHYAHADEVVDSAKTSSTLAFLLKFVPDTKLIEEVGSEMTFMLPTNQGQLAMFPEMFQQLEINKGELGISSYGVSDTTLEEVFLKLTRTADAGKPLDPVELRNQHVDKDENEKAKKLKGNSVLNGIERPHKEAPSNKPNLCVQIMALLYKRFWHHIRDYRSYFSQIILPVLFICFAMGMAMIIPDTTSQPNLLLTPELYEDTSSFYRINDQNALYKLYEDTMLSAPYLGPSCVHDSENFENHCKLGKDNKWTTDSIPAGDFNKYANPGTCQCDSGKQVCPVGGSGLPSPHMTMDTGLQMYNLTANQFPVNEYLSRTLNEFIQKRYGGYSFNKDGQDLKTTVWYNNKGYHSLPAYHNALSNIILRARLANQSNPNHELYGISVYNHPLPQSKEQLSQRTLVQTIAENGLAVIILCAFCFIPAGYTIFVVSERVHKEKRLQMIYGVSVVTYWCTALFWDMITFMFSVGLAVLVVYLFGIDIYTYRLNLAGTAVTLVLFGWSCIPLMYLVCRLFKEVSTAYVTVFLLNFFIGVSTVVCTFLLSLFLYNPKIKNTYEILNHIFKIFPQYCLGDSLVQLSRNQFITRIYAQFNIDKYVTPFSFDMIGWHLVAMGIQGLVFFLLNLILEASFQSARKPTDKDGQSSSHSLNKSNKDLDYKEDDDVSLERQRVKTGGARSDTLVLHGLRKVYRRGFKKVVAVDSVSLGVPRGECFGLLGVNGAGKTTSFNMITGEVKPNVGVAALNGRIISEDASKMNGEVGYCPQFDALDGYLTGRQLLHFYASIKGVPNETHVINGLIESLGLQQHANRLIKGYSGGTKRKLSTAIALLGNPKLVLLDEPTTGMDAGSRRQLWDRVLEIIKAGTSVVLTSHSMTECDALCTRMAIMVNGRFMCLGNSQYLKSKFGTGYTVITRVAGIPPDLETVVTFMKDMFPGSFLKDTHLNQLEFEIPMSSVTLGEIFGKLEAEKSMLHLQEYSVSQPTLDQVFTNFARSQNDGLEENQLDIEEGGHIKAYTNQAYGTIGGPRTPVLPRGRHEDVRESLKSIPGYGKGEVDHSDVKVDVSQPSTSASASASGSTSPASTIRKDRPHSAEISVVDSDTGDITSQITHEEDKTVVSL